MISKSVSLQVKGLAILMVIISHLNSIYLNWDLFKPFGGIGVAIFLLLSGYGLTKSFKAKGLNGFLFKRITTVMIPYIIVTSFWILLEYMVGDGLSFKTIVLSLLGVDFNLNIDPTMWYIPYIMFWYLVFYFVFKKIERNTLRIILLFTFSIIFLVSWMFNVFQTASYHFAIHAFTFPVGVLVGFYDSKLISILKKRYLVILQFIALVSIVFAYDIFPEHGIYYMFVSFAGMFFIILFFVVWDDLQVSFLAKVGDYSYELYLVEGYLMSLIINESTSSSVIYLMVYILAIALSAISLKKISNKIKLNVFSIISKNTLRS